MTRLSQIKTSLAVALAGAGLAIAAQPASAHNPWPSQPCPGRDASNNYVGWLCVWTGQDYQGGAANIMAQDNMSWPSTWSVYGSAQSSANNRGEAAKIFTGTYLSGSRMSCITYRIANGHHAPLGRGGRSNAFQSTC